MEDLKEDNNYQEFTKPQLIARINFLEKELDKSYKALTENKNKLEEYENKEPSLVADLDYQKEYEINQCEISRLREENEKYRIALLNLCAKL